VKITISRMIHLAQRAININIQATQGLFNPCDPSLCYINGVWIVKNHLTSLAFTALVSEVKNKRREFVLKSFTTFIGLDCTTLKYTLF
jgi:hypothetical protein